MISLNNEGIFSVSLAAAAAVFGAYVYAGLKTPIPGEDMDVSSGLKIERHDFRTADGALLRLKRYANPEGSPVLFCHGFEGNGFEFDLPREGHNIGVYLARRGFDVWISSFRGCGPEPYNSECPDWSHSIDHLAIYDAPALVDGIKGITGKKPFWIGHSMGGMVLYMYLQGVKFAGQNQVLSDEELVLKHNSSISGGVAIASPPAFWWPRRHPFQVATQSSLGRSMIGALVLGMRARGVFFPHVQIGNGLKKFLGGRPRLIKAASRSPLGLLLYCRKNTDADTTTSLIKWAGDDVSAKMFVQLADGIWNINFRQYFPLTFRGEPYDYTLNMRLITAPMLFVTGDKDFANHVGIRRYGYDMISTSEKDFVTFQGYGHTDLVMGKNVETEVYPVILDWLKKIEAKAI